MKQEASADCSRYRPFTAGRARRSELCLLVLIALTWTCSAAIPPPPQDREFFHDLANIVDSSNAEAIQNIQQEVFDQSGVPIVVVTVLRRRKYDADSPSIESFARRWFDSWGIGSQANNSGMLIIVSRDDRKARIELGAEWGGRFDRFCSRLMDQKMVPQFKKGDYGGGLRAAVTSLGIIAKAGPRADPPEPDMTERILDNPIMKFNRENNPIASIGGSWAIPLMIVAGLGCLVAAGFLPAYRKHLLIAGLALIGLALFFWVVVLLFAFLRGSSGSGDSSFSSSGGWGGGSSGGGFSGGSSGGGGASGSW